MKRKLALVLFSFGISVIVVAGLLFPAHPAVAQDRARRDLGPYETLVTDGSGQQVIVAVFPLPPPQTTMAVADVPDIRVAGATNTLLEVPAYFWSYGCSATSAAMLFGYYDRIGYGNMYTGPTNGGVSPLDNSVWGRTTYPNVVSGESPLSATHNGIDGRSTKGHVDDYWVDYQSPGDPYAGHWAEHAIGTCTGDYMGTNQWKYGSPVAYNSDGGTLFVFNPSGDPTYDYTAMEPTYRDGGHGMRLFAESRGYSVVTDFNQYIQGQGTDPAKGFTFANFQSEIDAGRPVLIHLAGHTMLGYGYNSTGNTIYVHDTWDYSSHTMTWGGTYSGLQHMGVTVIRLQVVPPSVTNSAGATNITLAGARLNSEVTATGGANPTVHIYWGTTDGGTTPAGWAHDVNLGVTPAGASYTDISGLAGNTTYYYRSYAVNSGGGGWAPATSSFLTRSLPTMEPIAEPEHGYYSAAPVLTNFGFGDGQGLDDGWYQMDSYPRGHGYLYRVSPMSPELRGTATIGLFLALELSAREVIRYILKLPTTRERSKANRGNGPGNSTKTPRDPQW